MVSHDAIGKADISHIAPNFLRSMAVSRRRLTKTITRRVIRRTFRKLTVRQQILTLIGIGLFLGFFLDYLRIKLFHLLAYDTQSQHASTSNFTLNNIIPEDKCDDPKFPCFIFAFATGRSGTQHLSRVFTSKQHPVTYITHEEEHLSSRAKSVVNRDYRRIASLQDPIEFKQEADEYVTRVKIPFYHALLKRHTASRLLYTGHLPMVFGMGPSLITHLPKGSVRIFRLRRERIATAVSLMALGPEKEDPWGATNDRDSHGNLISAPIVSRRWFTRPFDGMTRLNISDAAWNSLNRFQRWLWFVDDVECRWNALRHQQAGQFSWIESSLEELTVLDGGRNIQQMADFIGVDVKWSQVGQRDNSIQHKNQTKLNTSEAELRKWDLDYRKLVGRCVLDQNTSFAWNDPLH